MPSMSSNPVAKACEWLLDIRNEDDGWGILAGTAASSTITNTAEVLYALALCEVDRALLQPSVECLCRMIDGDMCKFVRHFAWSCMALLQSGLTPDHPCVERCLQWIRDQRHEEGGWAHSPGGKPTTYPTFLAVYALLMATRRGAPELYKNHASHGVVWLVSSQNQDGGWGFAPGEPSNACSTSYAVIALREFRGHSNQRSTNSAVDFICSRQRETGAWDDDIEKKTPSNGLNYAFHHFATSWALMALRDNLQLLNSSATRGLGALYELQSEDGGWHSPSHGATSTTWATSQAILALKGFESVFDFQSELPKIVAGVISLDEELRANEPLGKGRASDSYLLSAGPFWLRISTSLAHALAFLYTGTAVFVDIILYPRLDAKLLEKVVAAESLVLGPFIYAYATKKGKSKFNALLAAAALVAFVMTLVQLLL